MVIIPDTIVEFTFRFPYLSRRKGYGYGTWRAILSSRTQLEQAVVGHQVARENPWTWVIDYRDDGGTVEFVVRRDLDSVLDLYWVERQLITLLLACEYQLEAPHAAA